MEDVIQQVIGSYAACLMAQAVISIAFLPWWTDWPLRNRTVSTEGLDFRECSSLAISAPVVP